MATAKKLPSGSWRVQSYVGKDDSGKRLYKSFTAPTKKAAELAAATYVVTRQEQQDPANMTVGDAITRYIDTRSAVLSPSTVRAYRGIRKTAFPALMPVKLSALTEERVQIAVSEDAAAHSPKSVRNHYALLTAALSAYYPSFKPRVKLPQRVKHEISIPDNDQLRALLAEVAGTRLELPIVLAAFMGLRRSEICALTPDDYDPAAQTLSITKAIVRDENNLWVLKPTKSFSSTRILSVSAPVAKAITDHSLPVKMTPAMLDDAFNHVRKHAGLSIRFHDLRHYHASLLLALNIPDKYAMELMGHATPNMLKTVYQHTMADKRKAVASALENAVTEIMQHEKQHGPEKPQ